MPRLLKDGDGATDCFTGLSSYLGTRIVRREFGTTTNRKTLFEEVSSRETILVNRIFIPLKKYLVG